MGNEVSNNRSLGGYGLRILGVDKDSCLRNEVALYEDFVVEINGTRELRYFDANQAAQ